MSSLEEIPGRIRRRISNYLGRRTHRSFKLTRRRDVPKNVKIGGYIAFTNHVWKTLWEFRGIFLRYSAVYILVATALIGIVQQDQYKAFTDSLNEFGPEIFGGNLDGVSRTVVLFGAAVTGGMTSPLSEVQQLNLALLGLLTWLIVVWLLRQLLAGNSVNVRDGLYNGAAPFVSTLCIALVAMIQAIPAGLAIVVYSTAYSTGWLSGGAEAMAFGIGALLLIILSLYWMTSTFFAGVIVTLPGTYPMAAMKSAGDLAFGRRLPLLLRFLWLILVLALVWALILIPVLLIDGALSVAWLPLVPVTVQILTTLSVIFGTAYTYLLYRKMVDADNS